MINSDAAAPHSVLSDKIPVRIAIVEDHPVMRNGLSSYFTGTGRWQVTGTASSLAEAKELFLGILPDMALLDIQLDDGWGLDIIPWLAEQAHLVKQDRLVKQDAFSEQSPVCERPLALQDVPVMAVYSGFNDYAHVSAALGMGVRAYVCKHRSEKELEDALQMALDGKLYIDDTAQSKLNNTEDIFRLLTRREKEILSQVKQGLSNKQIAAVLKISHRTVANIISCVYDKTGIHSRLKLERL